MAGSWDYESESGAGRGGEEQESAIPLPAFARDPLGVLRRRWVWMVLCLALGAGATAGVVLTRKPTYVAQTTILVSSQAIPEEFVRTTVVEDSLERINAIVGQVLSRQNLAELVEKYALYTRLREEVPLALVIESMRDDIEIYPQRSLSQTRGTPSSQVFVIAFEYPHPERAADVANELAGLFTAANIAMRNRQAQLTTDFLRRELKRSEEELRDHEHRITRFMEEHRGGLPGELQANLAKLERLQSQSQSLVTQIDASEGRLIALSQQPEASPDDGPTPRTLLGDLKARLEEQLVILTEEHPNVIALRRRIERLEADIVHDEQEEAAVGPSERQIAMAAEQHHLTRLREQLAGIEAEIASLDSQVEQTPMRQEEFAALEQRATVLRENYLGFLRKVQEAELAQSLESAQHGARISVLDRASPPSDQKHSRLKLIAAGLVASIGMAFGLAVLLELLDSVVVNPSHLETLSDKPILGSIPRVA
jgi:uncharacterized protein involved in exopolysaccharide biosynthesis